MTIALTEAVKIPDNATYNICSLFRNYYNKKLTGRVWVSFKNILEKTI